MDILKTATDWTKAEVFSSSFFIVFGILFALAAMFFWQLGKTEFARSFIYPTLVVGVLLMIIGAGLMYSNLTRIKNFPAAYENDSSALLESEIARATKDINGYKNVVYRGVPAIIVVAALLLMFIDKSLWRAISICTIGMMFVILIIDNNARARMEGYKADLEQLRD